MFRTLNAVGLLYVALFAVSGFICVLAIMRARDIDDDEVRRGLVWLLGTAGGWALLKAVFFTVPDPFREPAYTVGLILGFATVWAWLYFCSAYTGQPYHHNTSLRRLSAFVFLSVASLKATNWIHGAYFTTEQVTTPFAHKAIEHGVLHWLATGLSYILASIGLFMIFQLYLRSNYDTRPLSGLAVLIGLPVALDIVAQLTPLLLDIIYAPLGVAAFALGVLFVFERRFLAVQQTVEEDDISIYLDEYGQIQEYTAGARELFPELAEATGKRLSVVVPSVAETIDSEDQILERTRGDDQRYYFLTTSTVSLGDAGVQVIQVSDVTETERQRRTLIEREQELNEQTELYRAVLDASFAFVFRLDLEGRYTFVSPSIEEFLGYTPEELDGKQFSVTLPDEETTERAWNELSPVLEGEPNRVRGFPLETKAGPTVYADIRAVPIYDGNVPVDERTTEDIVGIQLMTRDATERQEREGLISVINRVLRHNLRNKMTVIVSYADMLEAKLAGDDAEKAAQIKTTGERLLDLSETAQRIEENREQSPELDSLDVVPIVERVVSQIRRQSTGASITVDTPETAIVTTHERLETALWEVLDNAVTHGGDPPSVGITVTVKEQQVTIAVSDNGPGLPEIEQEVLESKTETQLVHGDGLGLWLVYWIVTSLTGDIEATTESDGTTVIITLPTPS
jgi:PAS domain S-box-containing protein